MQSRRAAVGSGVGRGGGVSNNIMSDSSGRNRSGIGGGHNNDCDDYIVGEQLSQQPRRQQSRSRSSSRHRSQHSWGGIGSGGGGRDNINNNNMMNEEWGGGGSHSTYSEDSSHRVQSISNGKLKRRSATLTNSYDDLVGIASAIEHEEQQDQLLLEQQRQQQTQGGNQQWFGGGVELKRSQNRVDETANQLRYQQQQQEQQQVESLRDYWRKRAEESKERIVNATSSSGTLPTTAAVLGGSVGSSVGSGNRWSEKVMDEDDSTRGSLGGGGGNRSVNPPPPPPPPRRRQSGNNNHGSSASSANSNSNHHHRARSKSRGRSDHGERSSDVTGSGGTASSPVQRQQQQTQPQSPRKVDSIASALIGHSLKNNPILYPPSSMSSDTPYRSRPQASSPTKRQISASNGAPTTTSRDANYKPTRSKKQPTEEDQSLLSLSPLHHSLATSSWPTLHAHIQSLSEVSSTSEIAKVLSLPHPRLGKSVLHVASWKAPPALAAKMIRLLPRGSRELSVLLGIKDEEGNTPLHLCVGNLDYRVEGSVSAAGDNNGDADNRRRRRGADHLGLLKEIMKSAPANAWTIQNSEGDTPLHMFVSSPLCTSDWRGLLSPITEEDDIRSKLAKEAISLVLATPDAVEACLLRENSAGATPLHIALASGAHDCVIESLLSASPSSVGCEDGRGMLPLHWAAAFGRASYAVVKRLVEQFPLGLTSATVDGDIPLHLAVSNAMMEDELRGVGGAVEPGLGRIGSFSGEGDSSRREKNRLKIVELLMHDRRSSSSKLRTSSTRDSSSPSLDSTTSPILTANREKLTPLHCCALFDAPPQISKLLMKHPDANVASSTTNSFGATPLHLAAAQPGVSQSIATVLAIGTPDAAAVQDRLKRTPLHVAAQNTYATNLLIKTLAELNPNAATVKTQRGHLPLHLAAQSQAKEAVIRALIKAYPAAAESRNKSNNTPLHDAAKYRASLGVVRLLLDAYPGALYVQNQYGNLPLHCATAYQAPSEVVQLLLKSWPEGASMQNRNQDAPLHYAAAYATSTASVRPLIEAAPAAVLLLNSSGQSPVDRAKANNAPKDIVRLLERAAEDYSRNATSGDGSWASFGQGGSSGGGDGGGGRLTKTQASF